MTDEFWQFIGSERAKPVESMSYLIEHHDAVQREIVDARQLYYTLLHAFKAILAGLVKVEGPIPGAEIMGPFFENGIKCLSLYEKWAIPPTEKDVVEKLGEVFIALHPHVLQELWTTKWTHSSTVRFSWLSRKAF